MTAGDAKNEVPITNVAKIEFPGSPRKKPPSKAIVTGDINSLKPSLFRVIIHARVFTLA